MMPIIDALNVAPHTVLPSDICIVGGGAAGIAIAREFIGTPYQVLLLESGGFQPDEQTQSLYDVENAGHPLRIEKGYVSRNRYFGGSTNTWAGRCIALNDIDFRARPWVKNSGWPFSKRTLDPFYQRAAQLLKLPEYQRFAPATWRQKILSDRPGFLFDDPTVAPEVALFAYSPIKMAAAYGSAIKQSSNIRVCIHANVTEIEPNQEHSTIERLHVSTLSHNQFWVKSRLYILACGGWENARLLLLSRRHSSQGLGNRYDLVGRYYMEHPKVHLGRIYPTANTLRSPIFQDRCRTRGGYVQLGLRLSDQQQEQAGLLNHLIELIPGYPAGLPEASKSFQWVGSHVKHGRWASIQAADIRRFAPRLGELSNYFIRKHLNRPIPYPYITVFNHFEQAPNWNSRVMLGRQRDRLGQQQLKVQLSITHQETESLARFHAILEHHLRALGVGDLVSDFSIAGDPFADLTDSSHHMGTTRIGDNPRRGVVDRNCKIHGIDNLYVAGSSVFPTGGHANPTLTILAIALRLADYLKTRALPVKTASASPAIAVSSAADSVLHQHPI